MAARTAVTARPLRRYSDNARAQRSTFDSDPIVDPFRAAPSACQMRTPARPAVSRSMGRSIQTLQPSLDGNIIAENVALVVHTYGQTPRSSTALQPAAATGVHHM